MRKLNLKIAAKRLKLFADTIGKKAPPQLLDAEGAPHPELLRFSIETGASLDFIFCGDLRPMIRAAYAGRSSEGGSNSCLLDARDQASTLRDLLSGADTLLGEPGCSGSLNVLIEKARAEIRSPSSFRTT